MSHNWVCTIIAPERRSMRTGEILPEVQWFPHCFDCGAHVVLGPKPVYRPQGESEWSYTEPPCLANPQEKK